MAVTAAEILVKVGADVRQFQAAMAGVNARIAGVSKSFTAAGASIGAVGTKLTRSLTLPIVAAGVGAAKLGLDFEKAFTDIRALVGSSAEDIEEYKKGVLDLAKKGVQSPKELAEAMYFIVSSGFAGADALKILEASAQAATAGLGETKIVADAVTSAVNAYGQAALPAAKATDILLAAVREGKAEPEELAASIGRVIAPAQAMGVEFEEVAGALAALSLVGIDAAEGTTAVRAALTSILKPAKETRKFLDESGESIAGLRKEIKDKGLVPTFGRLAEKFKGNQDAIGKLFPNVRALNGFLALTGANAEKTAKIMAGVADSTGDTAEAYEKAMEDASNKIANAWANIQVAAIKAGAKIIPVLGAIATKVSELIDRFDKLSPRTKKIIAIIAGVAAALGPTLIVLGKFLRLIGFVISPLGLLATAVAAVGVVLGKAFGPEILAKAKELFPRIRDFAVNAFEKVRAVADQVWPQVRRTIMSAFDFIRANVPQIKDFLRGLWDGFREVGEIVLEIGRKLEGPFRAAINAARTVIEFVVDKLGGWREAGEKLIKTLGVLLAAIVAYQVAIRVQLLVAAAVAFVRMAIAAGQAAVSVGLLNTAMRLSPIGLIAGLVAGAATAIFLFRDSSNAAEQSLGRLNNAFDELNEHLGEVSEAEETVEGAALRMRQAHLNVTRAIRDRNKLQQEAIKVDKDAGQTAKVTADEQLGIEQAMLNVANAWRERNRIIDETLAAGTKLIRSDKATTEGLGSLQEELLHTVSGFRTLEEKIESGTLMSFNFSKNWRKIVELLPKTASASEKSAKSAGIFADKMDELAKKADTVNPKLSAFIRNLAEQARETGRIPKTKGLDKLFDDLIKEAEKAPKRLDIAAKKFGAQGDRIMRLFEKRIEVGARSAVDTATTKLGEIVGAVESLVPLVKPKAAEVSSAINTGLLSGLYGLGAAIYGRLRAEIDSGLNAIKSYYGIGSPSRVFADEVGLPIGEGIVNAAVEKVKTLAAGAIRALLPEKDKIMRFIDAKFGKPERQIARVDARRQAEDLIQAVKDAERRLTDVRKDGKKDEIVQAERDLARAREDITLASLRRQADAEQRMRDRIIGVLERSRDKFRTVWDRFTGDALSAFDRITDRGLREMTREFDAAADKIDTRFDQLLSGLERSRDALTPADLAIRGIEEGRSAARIAEEITDAEKELIAARKSKDKERIARAQKRLDEARLDEQLDALRKQADAERAARNDAYEASRSQLEGQRRQALDDLRAEQENQVREYEDAREQIRRSLEARLENLKTHLANTRKSWRDTTAKVMQILSEHGIALQESGASIGKLFAQGLLDAIPEIERAARAIAKVLERYLKTKSPAETGPLSDLDRWWRGFAPTLLAGLDTRAIERAANLAITPQVGTFATAGGAPMVIEVHSHVSLDGREIAETVRREQVRIGKRNPDIFGGRA